MDKKIEKLIKHQVETGISEATLCQELRITRTTFYNLKKGKTHPQEYTVNQVDKFIESNDL